MSYISEKDLINIIDDVLIIDVRGVDFKGGNIINAINIPYETVVVT
jgi:rhodanese-related sulfurtransferase